MKLIIEAGGYMIRIGLFCEENKDLLKIKNFALEKINENKESIIKIISMGGEGFDIYTDKAQYVIRLSEYTSRGCKLQDVYYYKIKDRDILDILHFMVMPLDWNDLSWRSEKHFICIDELI